MHDCGEFYGEVGRHIREFRKKRRMTQEALAQAVDLTRTSITNVERGRQKLLVHTLVSIADALGVVPGELLPKVNGNEDALELALKDRSVPEREWITKALRPSTKDSKP